MWNTWNFLTRLVCSYWGFKKKTLSFYEPLIIIIISYKHVKQHHSFFRVQERVLPCVQNSIENNSLRSPSDWFFSMTFDFEMAKRTSIAMCKKLKSIKSNNLQTIHSQIFNVYPLCPSSQSYINWIKIKWIIKSLFSHLTLL